MTIAIPQTINCSICGFEWHRSGSRGNEQLTINDVAFRNKCQNLDAGYTCQHLRAATSKARQCEWAAPMATTE